VSSDFRTRTLRRHLDATVAAALQVLSALCDILSCNPG